MRLVPDGLALFGVLVKLTDLGAVLRPEPGQLVPALHDVALAVAALEHPVLLLVDVLRGLDVEPNDIVLVDVVIGVRPLARGDGAAALDAELAAAHLDDLGLGAEPCLVGNALGLGAGLELEGLALVVARDVARLASTRFWRSVGACAALRGWLRSQLDNEGPVGLALDFAASPCCDPGSVLALRPGLGTSVLLVEVGGHSSTGTSSCGYGSSAAPNESGAWAGA